MKALVMHAPFSAKVEEVDIPVPGPGEVLVKVLLAGICGGDLHCYDGSNPYAAYPAIAGHEMVGRVAQTGGAQTGLAVGDLVTGEILEHCGVCHACRRGKENCCRELKVKGFALQGVFAEYAVYKAGRLHKVPDGVSLEQAVLAEPYSIGHHMAGRADLRPGDTALVIGASTIGLAAIDVLQGRGVNIIAADISGYKLEKAGAIGAGVAVNARRENLLERILELTDGEGVSAVIEATGSPAVMEQTPDYAAAGGTIVIAGIVDAEVTFRSILLTRKELSICGSRNASGDFEPVLELLAAGKLHPGELLTRTFPLGQAPEAFEHLHRHGAEEIKVAIAMEG